MTISKQPTSVTVTFSPDDYILGEHRNRVNTRHYLYSRGSRVEPPDNDTGSMVLKLIPGQEVIFREAGFAEVVV